MTCFRVLETLVQESFDYPDRQYSKLELVPGKWLKIHKSAEIMVRKMGHMCSAESPQVKKVNTNSQQEIGENGCRSCQKPACQVSEFYGLCMKTAIYSTCSSEMMPELWRTDCDKVNLCFSNEDI